MGCRSRWVFQNGKKNLKQISSSNQWSGESMLSSRSFPPFIFLPVRISFETFRHRAVNGPYHRCGGWHNVEEANRARLVLSDFRLPPTNIGPGPSSSFRTQHSTSSYTSGHVGLKLGCSLTPDGLTFPGSGSLSRKVSFHIGCL